MTRRAAHDAIDDGDASPGPMSWHMLLTALAHSIGSALAFRLAAETIAPNIPDRATAPVLDQSAITAVAELDFIPGWH